MSLGTGWDPPSAGSNARPLLWLVPLAGAGLASLSAEELGWGEGLPALQRRRYWLSRAGLRQVLAPVLGCVPAAVPLCSPPGQPPRLLEGLGWISLSHSGQGLLIGYSGEPIGVDLELVGRPLDAAALMRRFYPIGEQGQLEGLTGEALRMAVLTSWVLKEAAIKWRQSSLAVELRNWSCDHSCSQVQHIGEGVQPDCCTATAAEWRWAAVGNGCYYPRIDSRF